MKQAFTTPVTGFHLMIWGLWVIAVVVWIVTVGEMRTREQLAQNHREYADFLKRSARIEQAYQDAGREYDRLIKAILESGKNRTKP